MSNILIGSAWPYANGDIHLGHVAGLIAGDVLARYYRLQNEQVTYVSGTDSHGTPILITAKKQGLTPAELVAKKHPEFKDLFTKLGLSFDTYSTTTESDHKAFAQEVFQKLYTKGLLYLKTEKNPYSPTEKMFLADTYVVGTCPHCGYDKALGNQCENCGSLLSPEELINPKSKETGESLEFRETEQFYFALSKLEPKIKEWFANADTSLWRDNAVQTTRSWLEEGLQDRPVSRDLEWGVSVPVEGYEEKKIYVWFEAVLGYLSASKLVLQDKQAEVWKNSETRLILVHGKDNIPFHTIIFPAILLGLDEDYVLPTQIVSSEYLLLEGQKFSKSNNWAIWLKDALAEFDADLLRYHLILQGPETQDASFGWEHFQEVINTVLLGKYANLYNRVISMLLKHVGETVTPYPVTDRVLLTKIKEAKTVINQAIEAGEHRKALLIIRDLTIEANVWLNEAEPWKTVKQDKENAVKDLYTCLLIVAELTLLLRPFVPTITRTACENLGINHDSAWEENLDSNATFALRAGHLVSRIPDEKIAELQAKLG